MIKGKIFKRIAAIVLSLSLTLPAVSWAEPNVVVEEPTWLEMTGDLIFVRPVMLGVTVVGSVVWLVGLPFSALGGNVAESADTLVIGPATTTFVRCLGCTKNGYKKDKTANEEEAEEAAAE